MKKLTNISSACKIIIMCTLFSILAPNVGPNVPGSNVQNTAQSFLGYCFNSAQKFCGAIKTSVIQSSVDLCGNTGSTVQNELILNR